MKLFPINFLEFHKFSLDVFESVASIMLNIRSLFVFSVADGRRVHLEVPFGQTPGLVEVIL